MRAIANTGPGKLEMQHLPTPRPGDGQVRIRVGACAICATDLQMIDGWERTGYPSIPGHEWAGTVDAVGTGVDAALVGHRCVAEDVLSDGGEVGFEHPGGYGEYLLTEARRLYLLPSDYPLHVAALVEPLAVCVRGMRRLRLCDESEVLILGDGPIGLLMTALVAQGGNRKVVVVGGRAARLSLARKLGAAVTLDYHQLGDELAEAIEERIGRDFSHAIEASGSAAAMNASLALARRGGQVLVLGDYGSSRAGFLWNDLLHQELEVIGSCASAGAWPDATGLATSSVIPLASLVTHRLPASEYAVGVELARSHRDDVIKVVLEWSRT